MHSPWPAEAMRRDGGLTESFDAAPLWRAGTLVPANRYNRAMVDGAKKKAILDRAEKERVKFLRLQFTDILGVIKNVEVPDRQFSEALDGKIMFDGSSIEGFVRIEESDMYLRPDLATFQVFPWADATGARVGRLICDILNPDGSPFTGCPAPR